MEKCSVWPSVWHCDYCPLALQYTIITTGHLICYFWMVNCSRWYGGVQKSQQHCCALISATPTYMQRQYDCCSEIHHHSNNIWSQQMGFGQKSYTARASSLHWISSSPRAGCQAAPPWEGRTQSTVVLQIWVRTSSSLTSTWPVERSWVWAHHSNVHKQKSFSNFISMWISSLKHETTICFNVERSGHRILTAWL